MITLLFATTTTVLAGNRQTESTVVSATLPVYQSAVPNIAQTVADKTVILPSYKAAASSGDAVAQVIARHLKAQETVFTIEIDRSLTNQMGQIMLKAIWADDYVHYIIRSYSYSMRMTSTSATLTVRIGYLESKEQTAYVQAKIQNILKQIIKPGMNEIEKEKAIHDYIVTHVAYDTKLKEYTAYSALTKGIIVCQGYATLTQRMMQNAGIESRIVTGSGDGVSHAWNKVKIDGKWYDLDVTWDDPVPDKPGRVLYTYYNVTDQMLRKDHYWTGLYPPAVTNFSGTLQAKAVADPAKISFYDNFLSTLRVKRGIIPAKS
jgi:transglutaminase/protease-like cytokinesis protein 3